MTSLFAVNWRRSITSASQLEGESQRRSRFASLGSPGGKARSDFAQKFKSGPPLMRMTS
jgi:hypothetical protein